MKIFIIALVSLFVFSACSSRQYFEPTDVEGGLDVTVQDAPSALKSLNSSFATFESNNFVLKNGISKKTLPEGYNFLNNSNRKLIASNKQGSLLFLDTNETFNFKENVVAASSRKNITALVFANNSIALFDTVLKKYIFKKYYEVTYLNDTRIAMPIFLNNIILIPTLDGKVIVVNNKTFKIIRTISVDQDSKVKNIIFLTTINDTLIASSVNKIVAIGGGKFTSKNLFIQSYTSDDKYIYIATIDGTILKLDHKLNILVKKKFKFAKFKAIVSSKDAIYAIESQDYAVKIKKDFTTFNVYDFDIDNQRIFTKDNVLYFKDKFATFK